MTLEGMYTGGPGSISMHVCEGVVWQDRVCSLLCRLGVQVVQRKREEEETGGTLARGHCLITCG